MVVRDDSAEILAEGERRCEMDSVEGAQLDRFERSGRRSDASRERDLGDDTEQNADCPVGGDAPSAGGSSASDRAPELDSRDGAGGKAAPGRPFAIKRFGLSLADDKLQEAEVSM